jgi:hypothetical protein
MLKVTGVVKSLTEMKTDFSTARTFFPGPNNFNFNHAPWLRGAMVIAHAPGAEDPSSNPARVFY